MTPKMFLHRSTSKAAYSAAGFIAQYREYLSTGELAERTNPIIEKLDAGELLPTPALHEIRNAVMLHLLEASNKKVEQVVQPKIEIKNSGWLVTVYNKNGTVAIRIKDNGEEETLIKSFDMNHQAERWCDRRLFDCEPDSYAEVINSEMNISFKIERGDAIARILKKKTGPSVVVKGINTKTLGWQAKAKQDRASFSRG